MPALHFNFLLNDRPSQIGFLPGVLTVTKGKCSEVAAEIFRLPTLYTIRVGLKADWD